jgi:hypothetical protein
VTVNVYVPADVTGDPEFAVVGLLPPPHPDRLRNTQPIAMINAPLRTNLLRCVNNGRSSSAARPQLASLIVEDPDSIAVLPLPVFTVTLKTAFPPEDSVNDEGLT